MSRWKLLPLLVFVTFENSFKVQMCNKASICKTNECVPPYFDNVLQCSCLEN